MKQISLLMKIQQKKNKMANDKVWIVSIAINVSILLFLHNLDGVGCNCIKDWRYNFIKFTAYLSIAAALMAHFKTAVQIPPLILMGFQFLNIYALFTYIGDLDKSQCICGAQRQPYLFAFLNIWRWVPVIGLAILAFLFLYIMVIKK